MDHVMESEAALVLSRSLREASDVLFGEQPIASRIRALCRKHEMECQQILYGRGLASVIVAVVGDKGQGKTWICRQLVLDPSLQRELPSGVLARESTTRLTWIGPEHPNQVDGNFERHLPCLASSLFDLGFPYVLLDTPGATDAQDRAAEIAREALSIAPVQLLVIRRDQLRSSSTCPLVRRSEGVLCIPVITAISPRDVATTQLNAVAVGNHHTDGERMLYDDIQAWLAMVHASAPHSTLLTPILIEDFEATGNELIAGDSFRKQLASALKHQSLAAIATTQERRIDASCQRLRISVSEAIVEETPQLVAAVENLLEESQRLPSRVIESVLGSNIVLETIVRAKLRSQIVADTSLLWFPYRTTLSLLSMTQGAWDRVLLMMTGSLPSLVGTLVTWTQNLYQHRKADWELQYGLKDRIQRQVDDHLRPLQQHFYRVLSSTHSRMTPERTSESTVKLRGLEELQSQAQALLEKTVREYRTNPFLVFLAALVGSLVFWGLLLGPIVLIYRDYVVASYHSLTGVTVRVDDFPHPSASMLLSCVVLSFLPLLVYTMFVLAIFLRRSRIESVARRLLQQYHSLVAKLQGDGILGLDVRDSLVEKAQTLLSLTSRTS